MSYLRVGSGVSTDIDVIAAVAEAADEATADFGDEIPNLVVAFISDDHRDAAEDVAAFLGERYPAAATIGCTSNGVIAGGVEYEAGPTISLWAGFLPDTVVVPFGLQFDEVAEEPVYRGWPGMLLPDANMLVLYDRFSFPAGHFVEQMNQTRPGTTVLGGGASGGSEPGENRLFYGGKVFTGGAVVVAISGRVRLHSILSQGCRRIGRASTITRADRQMIFEIAGAKPVDLIRDLYSQSSPEDRALVTEGLQIGRLADEYKTDYEDGDFLVSEVTGSDMETGAISVADVMGVGQTVQFHVRDAKAADLDLRQQIDSLPVSPAGALLFTCTRRGTNLFTDANHDAGMLNGSLGVPLAGAFVTGELGPIGDKNYLHRFSASAALFVDSTG